MNRQKASVHSKEQEEDLVDQQQHIPMDGAIEQMRDDDQIQEKCYNYNSLETTSTKMLSPLCNIYMLK